MLKKKIQITFNDSITGGRIDQINRDIVSLRLTVWWDQIQPITFTFCEDSQTMLQSVRNVLKSFSNGGLWCTYRYAVMIIFKNFNFLIMLTFSQFLKHF